MALALRLREQWASLGEQWHIFVPERLLADKHGGADKDDNLFPFVRLHETFSQQYRRFQGHAFVGACGIAVRALAPLLRHKSVDPAVTVLDVNGQYAISLVSGHLGGANNLTQRIAKAVEATPIITTATDSTDTPALDMLLHEAGLRIVDWPILPRAQAQLLEQRELLLQDPCNALWPHLSREAKGYFAVLPSKEGVLAEHSPSHDHMQLTVHWQAMRAAPWRLRVAIPCLTIGIGCRKGIAFTTLQKGVANMLQKYNLAREAVAALATVREKKDEAAIQQLGQEMGIPVLAYEADLLASISTPNPSTAAGKRFGTAPFSVCEAAALAGAGHAALQGMEALVVPKMVVEHACTLAVAISQLPGESHE